MNELEKLALNLNITMGRVTALQTLVYTLLRIHHQPAGAGLSNLNAAIAKVEADALTTPIPEQMLEEMLRVLRDGQKILQAAAAAAQTPK